MNTGVGKSGRLQNQLGKMAVCSPTTKFDFCYAPNNAPTLVHPKMLLQFPPLLESPVGF